MERSKLNKTGVIKQIIMIGFCWAVFRSYVQFKSLISEGTSFTTNIFFFELVISILASSQLSKLEQSLKTWLVSILFSTVISMILIVSPAMFGVLDPQLVSILILGSIQPIATIMILSAPIDLLGSFLGQVLRNRLIYYS